MRITRIDTRTTRAKAIALLLEWNTRGYHFVIVNHKPLPKKT